MVCRWHGQGRRVTGAGSPLDGEHDVGTIFITGRHNTRHRTDPPDRDLASVIQLHNVPKPQGICMTLCACFLYVAVSGGKPISRFAGSKSSMRLMGLSTMRESPSRKPFSGSRLFKLSRPISDVFAVSSPPRAPPLHSVQVKWNLMHHTAYPLNRYSTNARLPPFKLVAKTCVVKGSKSRASTSN